MSRFSGGENLSRRIEKWDEKQKLVYEKEVA